MKKLIAIIPVMGLVVSAWAVENTDAASTSAQPSQVEKPAGKPTKSAKPTVRRVAHHKRHRN